MKEALIHKILKVVSPKGVIFQNPSGGYDIDGSVNFGLLKQKITTLKPFRFGIVRGSFHCSNQDLTSLEGAPEWVFGNFNCSRNNLKNLVGGPSFVGNGYFCHNNELTTLEGFPNQRISGTVNISHNKLTSLKGSPQEVYRDFICVQNKITSFEGAPRKIYNNFDCSFNEIFLMEGFPERVSGDFDGRYNNFPLRDMPKIVWGNVLSYEGELMEKPERRRPKGRDEDPLGNFFKKLSGDDDFDINDFLSDDE